MRLEIDKASAVRVGDYVMVYNGTAFPFRKVSSIIPYDTGEVEFVTDEWDAVTCTSSDRIFIGRADQ